MMDQKQERYLEANKEAFNLLLRTPSHYQVHVACIQDVLDAHWMLGNFTDELTQTMKDLFGEDEDYELVVPLALLRQKRVVRWLTLAQ